MFDWIKKHPYLTGGLVLVTIAVFLVLRSVTGGSSEQPAVSAGGQAGLSEGGQLQALNMAYGFQASQGAVATDLAKANLDASVQLASIGAARDVALATSADSNFTQRFLGQNDADVAALGITTAGNVALVQSHLQATTDQAAISSQHDLTLAGIDAATVTTLAQFDRDVNLAGISGQRDIDIANIQGQVTLGQAGLDYALGSKSLDVDLAGIDLAQYGIQRQFDYQDSALQAASDYATLTATQDYDIRKSFVPTLTDLANRKVDIHTNLMGTIASVTGNPEVAIAGQQKLALEAGASASKWSNIVGSISNVVGSFLSPIGSGIGKQIGA